MKFATPTFIPDCTNIAVLDPKSKTVPERCLTVAEIEKKYLSFGMPLPIDTSSIEVGSEESFENDLDYKYDLLMSDLYDDLLYEKALDERRRAVDELRKEHAARRAKTMSGANKQHEVAEGNDGRMAVIPQTNDQGTDGKGSTTEKA